MTHVDFKCDIVGFKNVCMQVISSGLFTVLESSTLCGQKFVDCSRFSPPFAVPFKVHASGKAFH